MTTPSPSEPSPESRKAAYRLTDSPCEDRTHERVNAAFNGEIMPRYKCRTCLEKALDAHASAIREATLEEAAQIAELHVIKFGEFAELHPAIERNESSRWIAAEIRALKESKSPDGDGEW